jgi:hypothetical protein
MIIATIFGTVTGLSIMRCGSRYNDWYFNPYNSLRSTILGAVILEFSVVTAIVIGIVNIHTSWYGNPLKI